MGKPLKGKEPESGAVMTTPTILNFHLLDETCRIAVTNRAVNRTPYGRIAGTAHITWRARDTSITLSDEVRAAHVPKDRAIFCASKTWSVKPRTQPVFTPGGGIIRNCRGHFRSDGKS